MAGVGGSGRGDDVTVLLVDSEPAVANRVATAIGELETTDEVTVVADCADAIDYLHRRGEYEAVSRPNLVLLDLTVDDGRGDEVLEEIKGDDSLRRIPVVVCSPDPAESDVTRSYERHANAFVRKPTDPDRFDALARAIDSFWLEVVQLPPTEE